MNIQHKPGALTPETVTTGPPPASRKVYYTPDSHSDVHVPYREIALADAQEEPLRVYDASGPYTDPNAAIDLARGLPRIRDPWIARRKGVSAYRGRPVQAVDNGDVGADKLVPACPAITEPRAAGEGAMVTQYEFARAGMAEMSKKFIDMGGQVYLPEEQVARNKVAPGE